MILQLDFNSIIKVDGEQYLHNERQEEILNARLERLEGHYKAVRELLTRADLPANPDNIRNVAKNGDDGLKAVVLDMTEKTIVRLCIPRYLADSFRRNAPTEISAELYQEAHDLSFRISADEDELPISADDYIFTDEFIIDLRAVRERISEGCRIRITEGMQVESEKILQLAKSLRALEMTGLNAVELVTKYARSADAPAPVSLFRDLAFRRHEPGRMSDGIDFILNEVGMRSEPMNPTL